MKLFDDSKQAGWIIVVGWETFQHYRDRRPVWIKTYLDLLERDEYLDLPAATRGLLHDLWLLTARRSGVVSADTLRLSRVLGCQVRRSQLESLRDAGFIEFSASKPGARPEQDRSRSGPRAREETEGELRERPTDVDLGTNGAAAPSAESLPIHQHRLTLRLLSAIGTDADAGTATVIRGLAEKLPEASLARAYESLEARRPRDRAAYVVATLKSEIAEQEHLAGER